MSVYICKNLSFGKKLLRASQFYTPLSSATIITSSRIDDKNAINSGGRQMSTALDLSGIYPPIPTPFEKNENIDWQSLKSNLNKWDKFPFKGRRIFFPFCHFSFYTG